MLAVSVPVTANSLEVCVHACTVGPLGRVNDCFLKSIDFDPLSETMATCSVCVKAKNHFTNVQLSFWHCCHLIS